MTSAAVILQAAAQLHHAPLHAQLHATRIAAAQTAVIHHAAMMLQFHAGAYGLKVESPLTNLLT